MAHHNSTPDSVLEAPKHRHRWVSQQKGESRTERRHYSDRPSNKRHNIPKAAQMPSTNQPYVRPAASTSTQR